MTFKIALAALLAASALAAPALAQEDRQFEATTLHLSASGETHVTPDVAVISLGVQTEAPTAAAALRQNRAQMSGTLDALHAAGIEGRDIQTSGLNLNPQYVFHQNEPRTLSGYQASNVVTIRVRDLSKLGATVDAVVAAGANQINGISFSLADPKAAQDQARRAAVDALQSKANLYAEALGYRIGRLVSLSDAITTPTVRSITVSGSMLALPAPPPPPPTRTEVGELDVTATVSAVYQLKK